MTETRWWLTQVLLVAASVVAAEIISFQAICFVNGCMPAMRV